MRLIQLAVATLLAAAPGIGETATTPAAAALEKIRGLAGDWSGTYEWSGAQTGGGTLTVRYVLAARGSAVTETLVQEGEPTMMTVYHLDGADLRMTHYCAAENQPRLKARTIDLDRGVMDFGFVDATNLRSPGAGHVHGVEMRLIDADHITLTFLFEGGGQKSRERIALKRLRRT